ncbi:MAG: response regulator [Elusimicrobiota bacterium]
MRKMIIIDDEKDLCDMLAEYFDKKEYEVYKSYTGNEGLEWIEKIKPDVVLLDLDLPDTSGLDILKEVRMFNTILMSGKLKGITDDSARWMGATGFIMKPFSLEAIQRKIDESLDKTKALTRENVIKAVFSERALREIHYVFRRNSNAFIKPSEIVDYMKTILSEDAITEINKLKIKLPSLDIL